MADNDLRNNPDDTSSTSKRTDAPDANRDPITGAPGAHPIGTGIGAAGGGAAAGAATGAVVGTVAGPVGTAVGTAIGAAVGAVAGGYAGKAVAENINPTAEHEYWRNNYQSRPYADRSATYDDDYAPAYQYGWESRSQYKDRDFNDVENDLSRGWDRAKGKSRLGWERAKDAVRDSWDRVSTRRSNP
jgi:hypothetical protein